MSGGCRQISSFVTVNSVSHEHNGHTMEDSAKHLPIRVAVVQASGIVGDMEGSLRKLSLLTKEAAEKGAKLVAFPEAFIGGYPKGQSFGVTVGVRTAEGRDDFRRYYDHAVEVCGPEAKAISEVAKQHAVYLIVGVIERDGGTLYCTALMFGPDGNLRGKHRKLMPTAMERVIWGSGDGSTLPVIDSPIGKIGTVICWENAMPLLRAAMYAKGIEIYCAITVDDRDTWISTMRHVAFEGRCFVLSPCQFMRHSSYSQQQSPATVSTSGEILIRGGSCIVGPLGNLLAGPVYGEECVLLADLDRSELARSKLDFDVVGHYSRPDVFQLKVNERPMKPVVFYDNEP